MKSAPSSFTLVTRDIDAVFFDLDGVVTRTAALHIAAWKDLFDGYLKERAARDHTSFRPFDADTDYRQYVDGKPRYDGVKSFLESRGITLPYGDPNDEADQETICGLGNKKNVIFHERLKMQGVEIFHTSVAFVRNVKTHGKKTAIVSASKNCAAVLEAAGLSELFDTRVDGVESARLNLAGKPAPDVFLEAAKRLAVEPARTVVVEDALAGVQAGRNGKFGLVIGVARQGNRAALQENGADVVVEDLGEIDLSEGATVSTENATPVPSALARYADIAQRLQHQRLVVFLDYDGTLTPIVDRPEHALLSEDMRRTISALAHLISWWILHSTAPPLFPFSVATAPRRRVRGEERHRGLGLHVSLPTCPHSPPSAAPTRHDFTRLALPLNPPHQNDARVGPSRRVGRVSIYSTQQFVQVAARRWGMGVDSIIIVLILESI